MSAEDLAYAAGYIDGEGCFSIRKNGGVELSVVNTCKPALDFLQQTLGGSLYPRKQRTNKSQWVLKLNGSDCVRAIELLKPHLREKLPQAEVILACRTSARTIRIPGRKGCFSSGNRETFRQSITDLKRI